MEVVMFNIFKKNSIEQEPDLLKITFNDIKEISAKYGPQIIIKAAKQGNLDCQITMSQLNLGIYFSASQNGTADNTPHLDSVISNIEIFTELAANQGDVGSQFNLAKYYLNRGMSDTVNETNKPYIKKCEYWYKRAADNNYANAIKALNDLDGWFRMADE